MDDMKTLVGLLGSMGGLDYGQGQNLKGGQPVLPKPAISQPGLLSPYAPEHGEKPSKMGNSPNSAAGQLARYLIKQTDPTMVLRGGQGVQ